MKLEILEANYWEHFKFAKDLSLFYPIKHPKRIALENKMNDMLKEINEIKSKKDGGINIQDN